MTTAVVSARVVPATAAVPGTGGPCLSAPGRRIERLHEVEQNTCLTVRHRVGSKRRHPTAGRAQLGKEALVREPSGRQGRPEVAAGIRAVAHGAPLGGEQLGIRGTDLQRGLDEESTEQQDRNGQGQAKHGILQVAGPARIAVERASI